MHADHTPTLRSGRATRAAAARTAGRAAALLVAVALALSACTAGEANDTPGTDVTIIDVRTPQEFAAGHLQGATNIPVELPTFTAQIDLLPTDGTYLVYCRTGRRAEAAIEHMESVGMTAENLGSLEAAARHTGTRIVR